MADTAQLCSQTTFNVLTYLEKIVSKYSFNSVWHMHTVTKWVHIKQKQNYNHEEKHTTQGYNVNV